MSNSGLLPNRYYSRAELNMVAETIGMKYAPAWIVQDSSRRMGRGVFDVPEFQGDAGVATPAAAPRAAPAATAPAQPQGAVQQRVAEIEERNRQASAAPRTDTTPAASRANTPVATQDPATTTTIESAPTEAPKAPEDSFDKTKALVGETGEKIGRGLRFAGDAAGLVSTYNLIKNGPDKAGGAKEVSQYATAIGTGLDILGAFIPVLEPFGEAANAVAAIADTVDTYKTDNSATNAANKLVTDLPTRAAAQVKALGPVKANTAPVNTMVSSGLVATQSQHLGNLTQGTGSF